MAIVPAGAVGTDEPKGSARSRRRLAFAFATVAPMFVRLAFVFVVVTVAPMLVACAGRHALGWKDGRHGWLVHPCRRGVVRGDVPPP